MCLLEAVEHWDDAGICCTTRTHRDPDNPLRNQKQLAAVHLCEYGAQAMALHGALLARRDHPGGVIQQGLLVALRDVAFAVDRVDDIDGALSVLARKKIAGTTGALYEFEVRSAERRLASGRVSVIYP